MEKKKKDKLTKNIKKIAKRKVTIQSIVICAIILIVAFAFIIPNVTRKNKGDQQKVITVTTLEKVVKSSSLSTYETVYNGVAEVKNKENSDEIDYYVTYEATVKAGLDFDQIVITKNEQEKQIIVSLPEIKLYEPIVAIEKIDYIINNKKIDKQGLISEAYSVCINDVKQESSKQSAIFKYAQKNAENLIEGLLSPFVEQMEEEYIICFD